MADIYDDERFEPRKGVGYLLHRVRAELFATVDRAFTADEDLAAMGVTSSQFIVLASLQTEVEITASVLCRDISYDGGAMTRMLDRLEEKGLLRRIRLPEDRRQVYLQLTERGRCAVPRMRNAAMTVVNRFLDGFTRSEARQLEGLLNRMINNARQERSPDGFADRSRAASKPDT
jgi:MarR family transcriptional regulator, multiple antibiotic resistance protein MarR